MEALTTVPGILSVTELVVNIIDRFGGINPRLKITKEKDIKEPTSEFVVTLYVEYLRYLKIDSAMSVEATKKFDYPEAFMDTLPMMKIFKPLRKFFDRQKASDFSMVDLTTPTYKRTYGGIAVMDNYISFCQMSMEMLDPKLCFIKQKMYNMQEICKKKDNLIAESNRKDAARSQRAHKLAELDCLLSAKKSSYVKLTAVINEKSSQETELMSKLQAEKLKTNALKESIKKIEEELNLQKNLVVLEPEQILREDLLKKESLKQMTGEIADFKRELDRSQKAIQVFEQMIEIQSHFEKHTKNARKLKQVLDEKEILLINQEGCLENKGVESKSKRDEFMKKKAIVNKLKENLTTEKAKAEYRLAAMEKTVQELKVEREKVGEKIDAGSKASKKLIPLIKKEQEKAEQWIDTKNQCEALVVKKKDGMDEEVRKQGIEIDKIQNKVRATAEALYVKAAKELAEVDKLLNEQRAKDAAEGRTYKPVK